MAALTVTDDSLALGGGASRFEAGPKAEALLLKYGSATVAVAEVVVAALEAEASEDADVGVELEVEED